MRSFNLIYVALFLALSGSLNAQTTFTINNMTNRELKVTASMATASGSDCGVCQKTVCLTPNSPGNQLILGPDPICDKKGIATICIVMPGGNCSDICDCVVIDLGGPCGGSTSGILNASGCTGCDSSIPINVSISGNTITAT
jgi:hypothetical protein